MKKITFLLFISIFSMLSACKSSSEQTSKTGQIDPEKLKEEAFKIHDDVMPISMNLENLREEVMKKAGNDEKLKAQALEISKELDQAYTDMETWMPKLGNAADLQNVTEKIKALTEAKEEGLKIKEKTLAAKQKAENFLK